jgi:uncharacterized protein (TIGR02118 family)
MMMIKVLAVLHKRADMSREEFVRYWREVHAPLAEGMKGVRRYVINPTLEAFAMGEPSFDGLAELWFDDAAAARVAFASPVGIATTQDVAKFAQPEKTQIVIAEEITIIP